MSDEQKNDQNAVPFEEAAEDSLEAGIADESAAYQKAMTDDGKAQSAEQPSADDMGDFA